MNGIEYVTTLYKPEQNDIRCLISGIDTRVHAIFAKHIVKSIYDHDKILFILNNTHSNIDLNFGNFKVLNPLDGEVNLCSDLFNVFSPKEMSRFRSLLKKLGFEQIKIMQIISYLSFIKETETRLGNNAPISIETLEEYSGTILVQHKLRKLVERKRLSDESYNYLLRRYAEVSSAAADFEMFLLLFAPFIGEKSTPQPSKRTAVHLTVGEYATDPLMQEVMCSLMLSFIKKNPEDCSVLIIDDAKSDSACIIDVLKNLPTTTEVHMFTKDAFSLDDEELNLLMHIFPVRIYTRHDSMDSCAKIEECCGYIDVVKKSYSTAVDKRIRASTAFDMLFGTNRTETEARNAPVKEARYRKEMIYSFSMGSVIIDCNGMQVLFQF